MKTNTPLKDAYDKAYITRIAKAIRAEWNAFDAKAYVNTVLSGEWDALELKARMGRIAGVLDEMLPSELDAALAILGPAVPQFDGYHAMFFPGFVELRAARDFEGTWDSAVAALAEYTEHSSSEFAVRPMIITDQPRMLSEMQNYAASENYHIRRLASEGCRPRLPWAMALPALKSEPRPLLPILEALRADETEYVRRSVANNLNDISKDHSEFVLEIAARWLAEEPEDINRARLVKHACRTLLKAGVPEAMQLFGFRDPSQIRVSEIELDQDSVPMGGELEFTFLVTSRQVLGRVRIEYAVHYQKANGTMSPKVFKISEVDSDESKREVTRRHSFRELSTRRHHPGAHAIAVIINGVEKARTEFTLEPKG